MNAFCTIITKSHLPYATALFQSIQKFGVLSRFVAYVVDGDVDTPGTGIEVLTTEDLANEPLAAQIRVKYYRQSVDKYRWSMKPVIMNHLLGQGLEKVIYVDSDIYFFSDPGFLLEELDRHNILLTPHWEVKDPALDFSCFVRNFKNGLYNAGFVAINKHAREAMIWWAKACLFKCEINRSIGLFLDQAYLNLFEVQFDRVKTLKHKGCNVANWNIRNCPRTLKGTEVLIEDTFPIVFIHFAPSTFKGILNGKDPLLKEHLAQYRNHLLSIDSSLDVDIKHGKHKKKTFTFFR